MPLNHRGSRLRPSLRKLWTSKQAYILLFIPGALFAGWWIGGQNGLTSVSVAISAAAAVLLPLTGASRRKLANHDDGTILRSELVDALDDALLTPENVGQSTGAMVVEVDRFKQLEEQYDHAHLARALLTCSERLQETLRANDLSGRIEGPTFGVALSPVQVLGLEAAIQLASRVQRAMAEPIFIGANTINLTVSVGFCLSTRLPQPTGEKLVQAATAAVIEAQRSGPGAIRSFSDAMRVRIESRRSLAQDVARALDSGELCAYFQPQISARDNRITGVETLARWHHPERGLIPPGEFLPALQEAGLMDQLGKIMVKEALAAIRRWDNLDFDVPRAAVNFSSEELSDPQLVDRIKWELDAHDLTPNRLVIEVLETVVANRVDDIVVRNLAGLAKLGCCLDLDDFGTGHASITSIRRFSIERIKIDRSFVSAIDSDPEQQKMVSAILTMADRLGLDALAEGVETASEQAMLTRLGCSHLQGFGIARPMPIDETEGWVAAHLSRQSGPVRISPRAAG